MGKMTRVKNQKFVRGTMSRQKLKVLQAEPGGHFQGMIPIGEDRYRTPNRKEQRKKLRKQGK
jgi:hypothetical protein